jgi:hypothetical protein
MDEHRPVLSVDRKALLAVNREIVHRTGYM